MFIDASALTAVLTGEGGSLALLERLQATSVRLTSPLAVWETAVAVARVLGLPIGEATTAVESYLDLAEVVVAPRRARRRSRSTPSLGTERGVTRRGSILVDCFAYACARRLGQPLLFKGDDFLRTDIDAA